MKDSKNIEIDKGDLVMLTIDTPIDYVATLIMFLENKGRVIKVKDEDGEEVTKNVDDIKYYPITEEGLEVAKFDNGNAAETFHREQEFIATNVEPRHLLIMNDSKLRGVNKILFDDITAEL